jgi:hypothetical protein
LGVATTTFVACLKVASTSENGEADGVIFTCIGWVLLNCFKSDINWLDLFDDDWVLGWLWLYQLGLGQWNLQATKQIAVRIYPSVCFFLTDKHFMSGS